MTCSLEWLASDAMKSPGMEFVGLLDKGSRLPEFSREPVGPVSVDDWSSDSRQCLND